MPDITKHQFRIKFITRIAEVNLTKRIIPMGRPRNLHCFVYTFSGTCEYVFENGQRICVQSGDVLCLAKGQDYSLHVTSDKWHYIVCNFDLLTDQQLNSFCIHPKNPQVFEHIFRKLAKEHLSTSHYNKLECMSILYHIYAMLNQETHTQYLPGSTRARLENVHNWLQTHITDADLQVSKLAEQAGLSEVYFRKLFQKYYNITPIQFITHERIAYAKTLMALPELQLEEIALQSGFASLPYFCKVFKSATGTTPAVYRRKLKENS